MFDEVANLTKWGRLARHQMSKVILEKKKKTIEEITLLWKKLFCDWIKIFMFQSISIKEQNLGTKIAK